MQYVIRHDAKDHEPSIRHVVSRVNGNTFTVCGKEMIAPITKWEGLNYVDCKSCQRVLKAIGAA